MRVFILIILLFRYLDNDVGDRRMAGNQYCPGSHSEGLKRQIQSVLLPEINTFARIFLPFAHDN